MFYLLSFGPLYYSGKFYTTREICTFVIPKSIRGRLFEVPLHESFQL